MCFIHDATPYRNRANVCPVCFSTLSLETHTEREDLARQESYLFSSRDVTELVSVVL